MDLLIAIALVALGVVILHWGSVIGLSSDSSAALAGALIGAFALLLGNWISRHNQNKRAAIELNARCGRMKALIGSELAGVAAGYHELYSVMNTLLRLLKSGNTEPNGQHLQGYSPRQMPFVDALARDIPFLAIEEVRAIATLRSNMVATTYVVAEFTSGLRPLKLYSAQRLWSMICRDMKSLAEAFDRIAPDEKFQMPEMAVANSDRNWATSLRALADAPEPDRNKTSALMQTRRVPPGFYSRSSSPDSCRFTADSHPNERQA